MILIFLVILVVLLLCDSYMVFGVLGSNSWWIKSLLLVPSVAYVAVIAFTLLLCIVAFFSMDRYFTVWDTVRMEKGIGGSYYGLIRQNSEIFQ